jgi:shikimate kinase
MGSYTFLDTDEIIEKATNLTIPEIFQAEGEEGFRNVESQVLTSVHPYVRCVISTGGGIVCRMENWSKLQTGLVVWLDVQPETIMKRIEGTDRPLLQTEDPLQKLTDLLEERKEKYSQADVRIEISDNMDAEEVANLVVKDLHDFIDVSRRKSTRRPSRPRAACFLVISEISNILLLCLRLCLCLQQDNPPAWKLAKAKAQAEGLDWVQ